jgi:hypothetical protein
VVVAIKIVAIEWISCRVHLFDKTKQLNRLPFRGTAIKETTVFRYQAMNFFECTKPGYRALKTTIFLNTLL